jgi:hypothetical protein
MSDILPLYRPVSLIVNTLSKPCHQAVLGLCWRFGRHTRYVDRWLPMYIQGAVAKSIIPRLEKARLEGRSWLYRWLHARYDELAPVLNQPRPPWVPLARTIRDDKDWPGKPEGPSRQAVRDAWLRVEKDAAAKKPSLPGGAAKPQPPPRVEPTVRQTQPTTTPDDIRARLSPGRKMPDPL